jgi:Ca2+-binding RTX toxin-like protein
VGSVVITVADDDDYVSLRSVVFTPTVLPLPTTPDSTPLVVDYKLEATDGAFDTASLTINRIDNTITGTAGNDVGTIDGTAGNESISGEAGNDVIEGGLGYDIIAGGTGDDVIYGDLSGDGTLGDDDRISGNEGEDELYGGAGDDFLEGGAGNDILDGGIGDDRVAGGSGDDILYGYDGDDILTGGEGDDDLLGGIGIDDLQGGLGNDLLVGGAGDDTLLGGVGSDILDGGIGSDTFVWELTDQGSISEAAVDTITGGFTTGSMGDILDLSDLLQGEENSSLDAFLHVALVDGDTVINVDQSGGGNPEISYTQQIKIEGVDLVNGLSTQIDILNALASNLNVDT